MKYAAYVLAAASIGFAMTGGASGQQQTFYSVKAGPKIPPGATPQAIDPNYLYYACQRGGAKAHCGRHSYAHPTPGPGSRPVRRPLPSHT